jgi:hypothetical protein
MVVSGASRILRVISLRRFRFRSSSDSPATAKPFAFRFFAANTCRCATSVTRLMKGVHASPDAYDQKTFGARDYNQAQARPGESRGCACETRPVSLELELTLEGETDGGRVLCM